MIRRICTILTFFAVCTFSAFSADVEQDNKADMQQLQSAVVDNKASIESKNSAIIVANNDTGNNTYNVYSITGQLIKSFHLNGDSVATVEIPKGFYVVKCNNEWSRKVIVR